MFLDLKAGEGLYLEAPEGWWAIYHELGEARTYAVYSGPLGEIPDFIEVNVYGNNQAFEEWRKACQKYKFRSKFFSMENLESMIKADKKNHILDENFINELRKIE